MIMKKTLLKNKYAQYIVCVGIAVGLVFFAFAETAYLQDAGNDKPDALTVPSYWNPAIAPAGSNGAETDFVVDGDRKLYIPSQTSKFPGKSLQIGASDFTSSGEVRNRNSGEISINDLRLNKGSWTYENNVWQKLTGNATVYSEADDPFVFNYTGFNDGHMNIKLTGDEKSAIKLTTWQGTQTGADKNPLYLQTDQSATYSGSWIAGQGVYLFLNAGDTSTKVFGKPLAEFNPEALKVSNGVAIRYEYGNHLKWLSTDNRGLMLDAKNGTVTYRMSGNRTYDFGWPIAGEGVLQIINEGTFNLKSSCKVPIRLINSEPKLVLCSGASIESTGALTLPADYVLPLQTETDRVTVYNLKAENAGFKFPVSSDGSQCAQLRLAGNLELTGRINLCFAQIPKVAEQTDIPVLVIDSAVAREFSASDFNPYGISGAQIQNAAGVKVVRNEAGDQVVYITVVPYVGTTYQSQGSNWAYFEEWAWNGVAPTVGDGNVYIIKNIHLGNKGEGQELTVPGERLVLNPDSSCYYFYLNHQKTLFPHLLALDNSALWAYCYGKADKPFDGQSHEVAGVVEVQTTPGRSFDLIAARSQINVTATLGGNGTIRARSTPNAYTLPSMVTVSAINDGYNGAFHVYNDVDVVTNAVIFKISDEKNLGGNPSEFANDAFKLGYGAIFAPTAALTIDDVNRGVTFSASTNIKSTVCMGATFDLANDFTVETPVVFEKGAYVKTNSATFAWGRGGTTVAADVILAVKDGAVKPQGFDAFGGMKLLFSEGAVLSFDLPIDEGDSRAVYGVDMRTAVIENSDDKLAVRIDVDEDAVAGGFVSGTYPLATFADAASAQSFVDRAAVSQTCGYKIQLSVGTMSLEGADVATVFAKAVKVGFNIVIR